MLKNAGALLKVKLTEFSLLNNLMSLRFGVAVVLQSKFKMSFPALISPETSSVHRQSTIGGWEGVQR